MRWAKRRGRRFRPDERRRWWRSRPPGLWSERSPCSRPSAIAAARILPTVQGIAICPPSTALRLLRTLETTGFVSKEEFGTYRPGSRLIQLGAQALSSESLIDLARPAMEKLVSETGESAYLSVEGHGDTALYIGIVEGTHSVRHTSWVGRTVPLTSRQPDTHSAVMSPLTGTSSSSTASKPTSPRSQVRCTRRLESSPP